MNNRYSLNRWHLGVLPHLCPLVTLRCMAHLSNSLPKLLYEHKHKCAAILAIASLGDIFSYVPPADTMAYVHAVMSAAPPPPTGEPALPSPQPPPPSMVPPSPSTGPKGVIQIQGGIWKRGQVEDGNLHVLWLPGRSSGIISVDTDRFPRICGTQCGCMARLSCPRRRSGSRNHHSI